MNDYKKKGRIVGLLFLLIFIIGVSMYQFLQVSLYGDDFLSSTALNSDNIILSTLLGILSGFASILVAIILLPIFKRYSSNLGYLYVALCIIYSVTILIDNISVLSILELGKESLNNQGENLGSLEVIGTLLYERHIWTHYLTLLISCFPVFILYYTFYISGLIPKAISVFGIMAVILMFIEILLSIFGNSISMNMLLPLGLVQLVLPIWLIFKGLNPNSDKTSE
ncbi:DUF4386 domain-containing protein [Muriicola sp. E247]|uniref:DUF4386 domain-containing protein n=1 Tax=unclassified Muriicola TaxID=2647561 RepID=UPI00350EC742